MNTYEYWIEQGIEASARAASTFHQEVEKLSILDGFHRVEGARRIISNAFISGTGIEVGGGDRPFPIPGGAQVVYGDIRDSSALQKYFNNNDVPENGWIDAETFETIREGSLDFIISAHVIEHLRNPFGSILEGIRRLKVGGVYVIIVPDKRYTFDKNREPTSFDHLMSDLKTGGLDTMREAYLDHIRYIHTLYHPAIPTELEESEVDKIFNAKMDIHVHCWTRETFSEHVSRLLSDRGAKVVFESSVENESSFVIRREW